MLTVIDSTNSIILSYYFRILDIKLNDFICMEKVWARVAEECGINSQEDQG